jgi:hypothetical protein
MNVIPGRDEVANPESGEIVRTSGFRVQAKTRVPE